MYYVGFQIFNTASFWLCLVLLSATCTLPVMGIELVLRTHFPKNYQILREATCLGGETELLAHGEAMMESPILLNDNTKL